MKKRVYIGLLAVCCLWAANVWGAGITMSDLPYFCGFEDEIENANWVLNPKIETINTENAWCIGNAVAYAGGDKALYVSRDGGASRKYAAMDNVLLAYRDITLDAGEYDIAYDWIGPGNKDKGYLKIVYEELPESELKCLGNNVEPWWVSSAIQLMGNSTRLEGADSWLHVKARITIPVAQANKTNTRLIFLWVNTSATKADTLPTIAIDNFQLAVAMDNDDYPSNIHVATNLGISHVSWEAKSDSFEVLYRKCGEEVFDTLYVNQKKVTLTNVEYGAYEFWISSINDKGKSTYTIFPTVYLYETDCFDALNMYNAEFEYGIWQHVTGKEIEGTERVDYGPSDIRSRHTTHFDTLEIDPRTVVKEGRDTIACLRTVPKGEFGSVRLGNWNSGSEYESMIFRYTVESNSMAVLLIKYAMVLENPDHAAESQPRFTLDVYDEEGNPIDTKCASVDFHAPAPKEWDDPEVKALWHVNTWVDTQGGSRNSTSHTVNWQDWKSIGISVDEYVGQTLTIKLTAYDCDQGGHFGYAYFMLNCVRSDVDGLPWGDGTTTQLFTAPEGFDYAWFDRTDKLFEDTLSTERLFYVQQGDTNTYLCHVTYPTNKECGYWFDASTKSHNIKAEMDFRWEPKDCKNGYRWWNRCHITLTNQVTGEVEHQYDKQLENCYLIYENGKEKAIGYDEEGTYVQMKSSGGTVKYGIRTALYVNDSLFTDTAWYEFTIPGISKQVIHLFDTICRGEDVIFPAGTREKRTEPGVYFDYLKSVITGCDSTIMFHLFVHEPRKSTVHDTICIGGSLRFGDRTLNAAGQYTKLEQSLETGCDSIVTLNLFQAPRPSVSIREHQLCADQPLVFVIDNYTYVDSMHIRVKGLVDSTAWTAREDSLMTVRFTNHDVGYHDAIVSLYQPWCETILWIDTLQFGLSLASNLIELHWNDMLTFLASDYNGGMTFLSYQWYENGEPIEGADKSYYYDPNMQPDTEYSVKVTLADGSEAWVCPFTPADVDPKNKQGLEDTTSGARARKVLRNGQLLIICNDKVYTAQGQVVTDN